MLARLSESVDENTWEHPLAMLLGVKGIGEEFAAALWFECFYRSFAKSAGKFAAYAGLAATPWQSGSVAHEQGVSKAGNARLRKKLVQLAWLWLRHQPGSALARWFHAQAHRKVAIVALARKLLVALWKYVTAGVVIEGAALRALPRRQARRSSGRATSPTVEQQQHHDRSAETRSVSADPADEPMDCMASKAVAKNGFVLRAARRKRESWYGTLVRPTECEFDLASNLIAKPARPRS